MAFVLAALPGVRAASAESRRAPSPPPELAGVATANTGTDHARALSIRVPPGTKDGDLLVLFLDSSEVVDAGGLARWDRVDSGDAGSSLRGSSYVRVASSEPPHYTVTFPRAVLAAATMLDYRGVDTSDPLSTHDIVTQSSYTTALQSAPLTGVGTNDIVVVGFQSRGVPDGPFGVEAPGNGWVQRAQHTTISANNPDVGQSVVEKFAGTDTPTESAAVQVTYVATAIALRGVRSNLVDEVHYTFTGPRSVTFDWRGNVGSIRLGRTARYRRTVTASQPRPLPISSAGPFWQVRIGKLEPGTTYHYSIGGSPDRTFTTAPTGPFRFDVTADVGDSRTYPQVAGIEGQIAADRPAFVLVPGDLTYGDSHGQEAVDQHFDDVMVWSQSAAYMPAWGNHEWETPLDDLRNYKGRFSLPHPHTSPGAPQAGCCGQDWGWFDSGGVRFIAYPEPWPGAWQDWAGRASGIMAAAQANPAIHFIVTYGHRPAYSSGEHGGTPELADILDLLGDTYSKYVLNFNGHSHDYERFQPIHGVTHITASGGGAGLENEWGPVDPRTAFRVSHLEHVRVDVTATSLVVQAVCGPPSSLDETACDAGDVLDSVVIKAPGVRADDSTRRRGRSAGPRFQVRLAHIVSTTPFHDPHAAPEGRGLGSSRAEPLLFRCTLPTNV
ncbi:MAG: metallophosphoesterase family protein [Actinomycetota bacterium]|nr:metallophosphoesterase family protein [Actinomycetota bacterium]